MRPVIALAALALAACRPGGEASVPGDRSDARPFDAIGKDETLHFTGTEPFWGGTATGETLTWSTPENIDGTALAVRRFAGRGGLSFSGTLAESPFDMTVTPGECSDGMSDRTYPFVVTVRLGSETRSGCGWTEARSFTGPRAP